MKLTESQIKETYSNVITTKRVNEIIEKENLGVKLTKDEHIWFDNKVGVRKENINFAMTKHEIDEYTKCKLDIHYFANKYCQIKREDGTIGPMVLRDYQKDIIDLYSKNRYSILCSSRQSGKCITFGSKLNLIVDGKEISTTIGALYYRYIRSERKLTFLENIKFFLYEVLTFI